jgi:hypothetical protein
MAREMEMGRKMRGDGRGYIGKGGVVSEIKVLCKQSSLTPVVSLQKYYVV